MKTRSWCLVSVLALGIGSLVSAAMQGMEKAGHAPAHEGHLMVDPADLEWKDGPASLPPGAQYAMLYGDWTQPGLFAARIRVPANYKIPPHWHPALENVTVMEGSFYMGLGESFDESKAGKLPTGGYAVMEIGTRHFAFTRDEGAVVQLHGIGPWGIHYVNPDDDPRNP